MKKNIVNSAYSVIILSFASIVCVWSCGCLNEFIATMLFMIPILFSAIYNSKIQATFRKIDPYTESENLQVDILKLRQEIEK